MYNLTNTQPNSIRDSGAFTIFYYIAAPKTHMQFSTDTEITAVYSPCGERGWRAMQFKAVGPRKGSFEVALGV
ncbi:MAG: hypothetical protein ABI970_09745 [Chloroflexota bacterium]